jgi:hypothetical protein
MRFGDQRFSIPDRLVTRFAGHDGIPPSRAARRPVSRMIRRVTHAAQMHGSRLSA